MGSLYADGSVITREDLLERAERVVQCTSGEIPANPPKRIWPAMAKSPRRRDQLRTKHLPFTARSVEKGGKAVPAKSAAKKVGPKGTARGRWRRGRNGVRRHHLHLIRTHGWFPRCPLLGSLEPRPENLEPGSRRPECPSNSWRIARAGEPVQANPHIARSKPCQGGRFSN